VARLAASGDGQRAHHDSAGDQQSRATRRWEARSVTATTPRLGRSIDRPRLSTIKVRCYVALGGTPSASSGVAVTVSELYTT
jgi:hypothetical protein